MNLKKVLKILKLNEYTISMMLGALVIIVVGLLVINYFRREGPETTLLDGSQITQETVSLPTTHKVMTGETLWSISEKYYKSGYNWVDIAEANKLSSADSIIEGQELIIPDVPIRTLANAEEKAEPTQNRFETPSVNQTPEAKVTLENQVQNNQQQEIQTIPSQNREPITGNSYTVVRGDNLWNIAVRAYGDGFKWVQIAQANHLANPNLIHAGNVFVIPR